MRTQRILPDPTLCCRGRPNVSERSVAEQIEAARALLQEHFGERYARLYYSAPDEAQKAAPAAPADSA